jgi:hypothetical protein
MLMVDVLNPERGRTARPLGSHAEPCKLSYSLWTREKQLNSILLES